jgi:SagB-type dehydrogenase family enzyme
MVDDSGLVNDLDEVMVSELFHENSKQHRSDYRLVERIVAATVDPVFQRMLTGGQKRYPSALRMPLPQALPLAKAGFDEVVLGRRSRREFSGAALPLAEVAKLLHFSNGITGTAHTSGREPAFRASPSGGALYPVEVYVAALRVQDLPTGLYHYDAVGNALELIREGGTADILVQATHTPEVGDASVVFILSGIPLRTRLKYGERGYRFMLMEAGHICQNALLTATSLRLGAFPIAGFIDAEVDRLIGIDGLEEVSLYLVPIGPIGS